MARRFAELQKAISADPWLGSGVRLLSIALDPEFDRPMVLKAYGAAVGPRPPLWQFATGSKEQIEALSRRFAVLTESNGVTLDHTLCTALVDGMGRVKEIWRGNGWKADDVLAAVKKKD